MMVAALLVGSSVGLFGLPALADSGSKVSLSFDFSANAAPPSASGPSFEIDVDVLPERAGGFVRVVALAPQDSGSNNMVCRFQAIDHSLVSCNFNFSAPGTWTIKAQYVTAIGNDVSSSAVTNIRVGN